MGRLRNLQVAGSRILLLAVLTVFVAVCGDGGISGVDTGLVHVEIVGLGDDVSNSGTIRIIGEALDTTVTIPAQIREYEDEVPFGTWQVIYTPPLGYAMAAGASNDTTVTVNDDGPYEVAFTVVEANATVTIDVDGLAGGATDGGSASVLRIDIAGQTPVTVSVPGSGSTEVSVMPGTYRVTYTAPDAYEVIGDDEVEFPVAAGGNGTASFTVASTAATLRIQVSGVRDGAANAGSANVVRTDNGGGTPVNVVVPVAGTAHIGIVAGTYSVSYIPPAQHVIDGSENPQTVAVEAGDTGTASYQLAPADTTMPAGLLFFSDFRTALGTSESAVTDGGKWDFNSVQRGPNPNKEVIAEGASLDFPTPNVLEVISTAEDGGWSELRVSTLPLPAVGEHRYYRWYYRLTQPDNLDDSDTHPIQDGGAIGASNWAFHVRNTPFQGIPAGTYTLYWTVMGEANAGDLTAYRWYLGTEASPIPLPKNETLRFEIHWFRVDESHFNLEARIYDAADSLMYDTDDFNNPQGTVNLGSVPDLLINNLAGQAVLNAGVNGIGGNDAPFPFTYAYESGFCVRTDDWCGAYTGTF